MMGSVITVEVVYAKVVMCEVMADTGAGTVRAGDQVETKCSIGAGFVINNGVFAPPVIVNATIGSLDPPHPPLHLLG